MPVKIGYKNFVMKTHVATFVKSGGSHPKRLREEAAEKGLLINATSGHKTRSMIVLLSRKVVLSSLQTTTFKARLEAQNKESGEERVIPINIGYENFVVKNHVDVCFESDGSHPKRVREEAAEKGLLINATSGHKTRSIIVLTSCQVVLSSLQITTIERRMKKTQSEYQEQNDDDQLL